ncbi:sulfur carrier protein ThiS [Paenibacillus sp. TAF58]
MHINGQNVDIPDSIGTIEELLAHFDLSEKMLVVEHNGNILQKDDHVKVELSEGHKIEIVHFVGGG